jgi:hypothetical protein
MTNTFKVSPDVASNMSECVASDGSGIIGSNLMGFQLYNFLTSLNYTYANLSLVTPSTTNYIFSLHMSMVSAVDNYKTAKTNDITDQSSISELNTVASSANYQCSTAGFSNDSWVPSISQNSTYVPCSISNGALSNSTTCPTLNAFSSRVAGCIGCMDTYDIFKGNTSSATVMASLSSRYPDASCLQFNSQLSNIWGNFYKMKRDQIDPVETRAINAKKVSDALLPSISYFNEVQGNITNNFSNILSQ